MIKSNSFAGFIITYNRPLILKNTIEKVFAQSLPPQKLWIIDNSEDTETELLIKSLENLRLVYYRMGYNSGPAGAAAKGLELVANEGYDWIYWGDDNDPPIENYCFERLLALGEMLAVKPGILGVVGHFFNSNKGRIERTPTLMIQKNSFIEVDSIAGNSSMIISSEVVKREIFPNKDLFFGFEELDFCLKVKKNGFSLVVDCQQFLEARRSTGRLDYIQPIYKKKVNLNREYYSLRNLLHIARDNSYSSMIVHLHLKFFIKSFAGFRFGFKYGLRNFKMIALGFLHFWTNKTEKTFDV